MVNKDIEKMNIQHTANIIVELYSHKKIHDFIPTLNKGKKSSSETYDISYIFVNDDYSYISGKESLESILKKTIRANVPSRIELTPNGIMRDELKKGIDILRSYINNISANNKNKNLDAELEKRKRELEILEKKYEECLANGNFETVTNYKDIAYHTLKLLSSASNDLKYRKENHIRTLTETEKKARDLRQLIHENFGLEFDRRERWQIERDNKEFEYKTPEERDRNEQEKEQKYNKEKETVKEYYKNFIDDRNFNDNKRDKRDKKYDKYQNNNTYTQKSKYTPPHMKGDDSKQYIPPFKKNTDNFENVVENDIGGGINLDDKFPTLLNSDENFSGNLLKNKTSNGVWGKNLNITILKKDLPVENKKSTQNKVPQNKTIQNKKIDNEEEKDAWNLDE